MAILMRLDWIQILLLFVVSKQSMSQCWITSAEQTFLLVLKYNLHKLAQIYAEIVMMRFLSTERTEEALELAAMPYT